MLLTTVGTTPFKQACERLRCYNQRWSIEVFHRTLKSGCRIEQHQLTTAKLPRHAPGAPCTAYFEEAEW